MAADLEKPPQSRFRSQYSIRECREYILVVYPAEPSKRNTLFEHDEDLYRRAREREEFAFLFLSKEEKRGRDLFSVLSFPISSVRNFINL